MAHKITMYKPDTLLGNLRFISDEYKISLSDIYTFFMALET